MQFPASVSLIFVLFKQIIGLSWFRTRIVGVEDEHADHLATFTAQQLLVKGSGWVTFDTSFEPNHQKFYIMNIGIYCYCWKDENKQKETGNGPLKIDTIFADSCI